MLIKALASAGTTVKSMENYFAIISLIQSNFKLDKNFPMAMVTIRIFYIWFYESACTYT